MKKYFIVFSFIFIFLIIPFVFKVYAARLTPIQDIMSNNTVSATANNNFIFAANGGLPANATVTIIFPSGFSSINISSAISNLTGSTFSLSGNTITLSTTTVVEPPGYQVNINNIYATNPSTVSSSTVQYIINVTDSAGDNAGIGVVITSYSSYGSGPARDQYEQAITINNTGNSSTLTNYQVQVNINTASLISAGQMQSDCADIRFTDSSGNLLPYWIEGGCNTTTTQIWVNVNTIAASSNTTIYIYYGSLNASPGSNIHTTFIFGTQFNTLNSQIWGTSGGGVSLSPGNGVLIDNSNNSYPSLYTTTPWATQQGEVIGISTSILNSNGYRQRYYPINQEDGSTYCLVNGGCAQTSPLAGGDMGIFYDVSNSNALLPFFNGGNISVSLSNNTWYKSDYIMSGTTLQWILKDPTNTIISNQSATMAYNTSQIQYMVFRATESSDSAMYVKYMYVRKYSSPEPTASIGSSVTNLLNNQVELSLNVSPYIIFGVSSNNINLGLLSFSYITSQSNSLSLSTNAQDGANISIEDEYSGLYSSTDSYTIPSITTTLATGAQGYGINASSSSVNILYPYNSSGDSIGGLNSSNTEELASSNNIIQNSTVNINYLSSVSTTTPTGIYIDNITYIASGNF